MSRHYRARQRAMAPTTSPMGDERNRPVPCRVCREKTWHLEALCTFHLPQHFAPCRVCGDRPTPNGQPCSACTAFEKPGPCSLADLAQATEDKK